MVIFVLNVWLCFQEKVLYMDKLGNIFFPEVPNLFGVINAPKRTFMHTH